MFQEEIYGGSCSGASLALYLQINQGAKRGSDLKHLSVVVLFALGTLFLFCKKGKKEGMLLTQLRIEHGNVNYCCQNIILKQFAVFKGRQQVNSC